MTDTMSPARRRAEAAFSLLTHATTSLHRAADDAQSETDERTQKTLRLRNARLERERYAPTAVVVAKTRQRKQQVMSK